MHSDGMDEDFEPRKRRRCRTSKKKRQRLKQRASLEPKEGEPESENNPQVEIETRKESENQVKEQPQAQNTEEKRHKSEEHQQQQHQEEEADNHKHDDEEMTEYERKRRENILRNQARMQQLGFSSAKLEIRTAICSEEAKKAANEDKRQKAAERQALRAAQLAKQQTQPLRKSHRIRATEEMKMRELRRVQQLSSRIFAKNVQNARNRRLRERDSRKLTGGRRSDESDTEEEEIVDLMDESSTEEDASESGTEEDASDESESEEDEKNESTYGSGGGDSRPENHVDMVEPPNSSDLPAQAQHLDLSEYRPLVVANQDGAKHAQTSSPLQDDETQRSMKQTCGREFPSATENDSALEGMVVYERKRRENILRNQAFMQQVGVSTAKLAARTSIGDEAGKEAKRQEIAAKRELKAARRAELSSQPVRKSRRTSGGRVVRGHPTALGYSLELLLVRKRNKSNVLFMDAVDDDGQAFLKEMTGSPKTQNALEINSIDDDDAVEYSLAKDDVVKALPFRTTSMAFLPRVDRILVACGDKEGHVSLWSPSERSGDSTAHDTLSSAVLCRPHGFPVSELIFPNTSTLISSSVDGTVRELDLCAAKSSLVCDISDETGISSLITSSNPQFYYAGCLDGTMRLIDRRARSLHGLSYELHENRINTLDQHPSLDYCMVTASDDRTVCLWDKRKISSQEQEKYDNKKEEEQDDEQDEEENEEEEDSGLTEYERKRRENIQRNLAFMQQMGVSTAKIAARTAVGDNPEEEKKKQQQSIKRALQAARRAERLAQPVRKSRRLEGKKVEVDPIDRIDLYDMETVVRGPRPPRGSQLHVMNAVDGESKAFLGGITADLEEEEELEEDTTLDDDDGVEYTLADEDITKAVQERIYSVAFLPRADRVVVACGDKMGHVALWTPPSESMKQESSASPLAVYRPHYTPVSQLIFPDASKLVSSSFDGTVREFDLRAAESSVVYDTSDNAGISSLIAAGTAQCYYASCDDGTVRLIDRRTRKVQASIYELHEKKINTVSQHPSLDFCIATASLDRTVCLWDARKMSKTKNTPLITLPHHRSINCAYFSPRDGAWLVTVGQDSYIDMFDTSSLTERKPLDKSAVTLPDSVRVRHNNITGRWLTKLHAAWDPKRPNQFVIGCMEQPRRIQIFRAGRRRPVRELKSDNFASVHSINAFHPHLELIAGGNSSGRLALWRGKKIDKADVKTETKGKVRVKTE
ncbi:hypothetical protein PF010_g5934 [Phytophthora fragariae]|uniref:WD repeat-containing protein 76 n=1 Tax=Phytophthora fragariae TaxID=53985 RepID=A0A6G0LN87_9STRA|nr:hypothetical protein PF010_g5934 [Phytophthora fragariae]